MTIDDFITGRTNDASITSIATVPMEFDDDWLFARRVYNKLKLIPDGRDKEMLKNKLDADLVLIAYADS